MRSDPSVEYARHTRSAWIALGCAETLPSDAQCVRHPGFAWHTMESIEICPWADAEFRDVRTRGGACVNLS